MQLVECKICQNFAEKYSSSAIIHTESKPNIQYNSDLWKPQKLKFLFIAESPPYHQKKANIVNDSSFYNPNESQRVFGAQSPLIGTLSWNIFWLLGIDNNLSKEEKLEKFKGLGCFYIDAVKCRIERYNNKILTNRTVKNCSRFLMKEISDIKPEFIVVMGERSLYSIKCCLPFTDLIKTKNLNKFVEETQKKPLIIGNFKLFFIPLPLWRNLGNLSEIMNTFEQIKKAL